MIRFLGGLFLTAICAALSSKGTGQGPADPQPAPPEPTETVIRLKVQAMPAPKPALKYLLLPELREMNPGNPIQGYLQCFPGHSNIFLGKKAVEQRDKWLEMPLKDLPIKTIREAGYEGPAVRRIDAAARLNSPNWQALLPLKTGNLSFSDLQLMRILTEALQLRMRTEIADRRFDDAVETEKTIFALARHTAEHPTLVGFLVGIAIAGRGLDHLEEMLAEPGCPNLFWALADLPHPFVDLRLGVDSEQLTYAKEFAMVDDKAPMTDAQVQKVVDLIVSAFERIRARNAADRNWMSARTKDEAYMAAARKRLIENGTAEEVVKRFSALQIVFLNEKGVYFERLDEASSAMLLPYRQMESLPAVAAHEKDSFFARMTFSSLVKLREAQARVEQKFALLSCVEALRLYAADHRGQLPPQLEDVKLPLPVDPFSGKAFRYKLDGSTAILRNTPLPRREKNPYFNVRCEVTITK